MLHTQAASPSSQGILNHPATVKCCELTFRLRLFSAIPTLSLPKGKDPYTRKLPESPELAKIAQILPLERIFNSGDFGNPGNSGNLAAMDPSLRFGISEKALKGPLFHLAQKAPPPPPPKPPPEKPPPLEEPPPLQPEELELARGAATNAALAVWVMAPMLFTK